MAISVVFPKKLDTRLQPRFPVEALAGRVQLSINVLRKHDARRRFAYLCIPAICLALSATACRGKHEKVYIEDDEKDAMPASAFSMGDPAAARQLTGGFYGVEGKSWRWTAQNFVISFRTPADAASRGANLSFDLVVPDVVIQKLSNIRLAAAVQGKEIGSAQYTAAGTYTFKAEVPGELCSGPETVVDFHLDKALPASGYGRELGVIATAAALRAR